MNENPILGPDGKPAKPPTEVAIQKERKSVWLTFFVPLFAIIGAGGSVFTLSDRFFPPSVDVLGALPVYIRAERAPREPGRGIGFILEVRSGFRGISLTDLEIAGKKYLTWNQWLFYNDVDGLDLRIVEESRKSQRPFSEVLINGWPEDGHAFTVLSPHETAFIRFTLLEPDLYGRGWSTHTNYLGIEAPVFRPPKWKRNFIDTFEFFKLGVGDTRNPLLLDEINNGKLLITLIAGKSRVLIKPSQILAPKEIRLDDWKTKSPIELFYNRDEVYPIMRELPKPPQ